MPIFYMRKFKAHFFQLQYFIALGEKLWYTLDPVKDYQFDLNYDIEAGIFSNAGIDLAKKYEVINSIEDFGQYKAWKYGFDKYARFFISGQLYTPFFYSTRQHYAPLWEICTEMFMTTYAPRFVECCAGRDGMYSTKFDALVTKPWEKELEEINSYKSLIIL